jgi:hypothetical protein
MDKKAPLAPSIVDGFFRLPWQGFVADSVVPDCASEPRGDGGLTVAEDPFSRGSIQSFSQRREHHGNLLGRGFQTVERGVASGCERRVTSLTTKGLDPLGMAMLAISDEGMDVSIGDPEIWTLQVGTGKALRIHPVLAT